MGFILAHHTSSGPFWNGNLLNRTNLNKNSPSTYKIFNQNFGYPKVIGTSNILTVFPAKPNI